MIQGSRVILSRSILVIAFLAGAATLVLGNFVVTLLTVLIGVTVWLLYLLFGNVQTSVSDNDGKGSIWKSLTNALAIFGILIAISAFRHFALEQTIWGSYVFHVEGFAITLGVLFMALLPWIAYQLVTRESTVPAESPQPATPAPTPVAEPATTPETPPGEEEPAAYYDPETGELYEYAPDEYDEYEEEEWPDEEEEAVDDFEEEEEESEEGSR